MVDLTLQHLVMRTFAMVLIAAVHGFAVAGAAVWLGDPGPRHDGRLTLNPLGHVDLVGGPLLVLFAVGWSRPVTVDSTLLRPGRIGAVGIVLVAAVATLAFAELLMVIRPAVLNTLPDTEASAFFVLVETIAQLGLSVALFNLLPMPALTGEIMLAAVWPRRQALLRRARPFCVAAWVLAIASGVVPRLMAPALSAIGRLLFGG